ncbi:MAG: hypothetical protein RXR09_02325 [Acidilobus sp.]
MGEGLEGQLHAKGLPSEPAQGSLSESFGPSGFEDASAIALTKEGIPAAVVSVPTRYVHSPSEVLKLSDLEGVARLLALFTEESSPDWLTGLSASKIK